jgi:hypothetical protein
VRIQNDMQAFTRSVVNDRSEECLVGGGERSAERWLQSLPPKRHADEVETELGVVVNVCGSRVHIIRPIRTWQPAEFTSRNIDTGEL